MAVPQLLLLFGGQTKRTEGLGSGATCPLPQVTPNAGPGCRSALKKSIPRTALGGAAFLLATAIAASCGSSATREAEARTGGSVPRGRSAVGKYGCAACHTIPGIDGATANVGPPLDKVAVRQFLGGHLPNTPDNMVKWIQHPQSVDPKNVMPELSVSDQDARDLAAFLFTLR